MASSRSSRRRPTRLALSFALVFALAVFFTGCDVFSGAGAASGDTLRIGGLFAVSGFNSPLGTPEKETALLLEEQINAKGGINGRKVKMIALDTESDETKAVTLAKRLIESENVVAIIGPSSTGESLAIVDTVEKAQVPMISLAASAKITTPIKKWVFKTAQSDAHAAEVIFEHLKASDLTRVALLTSTGGFGVTGKEAIDKVAPTYGVRIVAAEAFGDKDTDMTVQLTKIKATDAQAVLVWGTNPAPAIIAKNMKQLGMATPLFQSHGVSNRKFIELAGDAGNGVIFPSGRLLVADRLPDANPQKAVLTSYARDFEAKYGKPADSFGGHAYDAVRLFEQAATKSGVTGNGAADRAKVRDELEKLTGYVGVSGTFNMSTTDHNGLSTEAFTLVRVAGGNFELAKP
jgi:branched-chain amino acid transport system substrate-binding protein